jgi:hypothetical protein
MDWRMARSLEVLLAQLNALAPNRNKASDGGIGDAAHSSRTSDHNPDAYGVVRARDFTHDPGDLDGGWLASTLAKFRDPRIKYIIWNYRIWFRDTGWKDYLGPSGHTQHVHVSVMPGEIGDDTRKWILGEDDDMDANQAKQLDYVYKRLRGMTDPQRFYTVDDNGVARAVPEGTPGANVNKLFTELDGNYLVQMLGAISERLVTQDATITRLNNAVAELKNYVEGLQ